MRSVILLIFALALAFGLTVANHGRAWACSCAISTLEEEFARSAAVFAGTVTEITLSPDAPMISSADPVWVKLDVIQAWKGAEAETVELYTARMSISCGYQNFRVGQAFLVFAYQDNKGALATGLCNRNDIYSPFTYDVKQLNALTSSIPAPATESLPTTAPPIAGSVAVILALSLVLLALLQKQKS